MCRDLERRIFPADVLAGRLDFCIAQCSAVHVVRARLVWRTYANNRLAADQRRLVGYFLGFFDRGIDRLRIVAFDVAHHVPAVSFETLRGIVGVPAVDVAVDGDVVVVPECGQLAQTPGSGQGAGFVRDAFHHAAVAHEDPGAVVDDLVAGLVEFVGQQFLSHRHTDGVGDALAQRAGGRFDADGVTVFRVARGLGVHLAEALQLFDRQVIAGQVQQRVHQHGAVAVGLHEAVTVGPLRIDRVVAQVMVPQHLSDLGHAHRRAGVPGVGLLYGIHRQHANRAGDVIEFRGGYITCRSHCPAS